MAAANARGGRRRWMLHEEARAAVNSDDDQVLAEEGSEGAARRYVFDERSVSYAVASRLLPHRLLALWALLVAGITILVGLTAVDMQSAAICQSLGITSLPAVEWSRPTGMGAWLSNLSLIVASFLCLLVYGLRRHRLDDYRGKYRRWLAAAVACGMVSFLLSTGLHHTLAEILAVRTGMSALPRGAIWWLVPFALAGGWLVTRVALDMRPCRLGLFALAIACGMYLAALAANFALLPVSVAEFVSEPVARCAGHVWLVIALLAQVRFILLEAAGQIVPSRTGATTAKAVSQERPAATPKPARTAESNSRSQPAVAAPAVPIARAESPKTTTARPPEKKSLLAAAKSSTKWVDGRSSRDADDEDEDTQPLSKAERKRLRKEQFRNRAA